jgi:putative chitobiose transport system permease protein
MPSPLQPKPSSAHRFVSILGLYGLLGAIAVVMLLPLIWLLSTSLKAPTEDIFQFPPNFCPATQHFIISSPFGNPIPLVAIY